jgi:hypothetical protein
MIVVMKLSQVKGGSWRGYLYQRFLEMQVLNDFFLPKIVLKKFTIEMAIPHFFNPIVFKTIYIQKFRRLIPRISKNLWYILKLIGFK